MKRFALAVFLTIIALGVDLQTQTGPQTQAGSDEQELIKLENDWLQAFFKNDGAFADWFLADDYLGTDEHGEVKNKAQKIAEIKAGTHLSTSGVLDNIKVRVYGDAAVVTGRQIMKGLFQGKEYRSPYLWTDVFIKRGGRWQCVASHRSRAIPPGKYRPRPAAGPSGRSGSRIR